jgi:hypothetical protein
MQIAQMHGSPQIPPVAIRAQMALLMDRFARNARTTVIILIAHAIIQNLLANSAVLIRLALKR